MTMQASVKPWFKQWWGIVLVIAFFYVLVPYLVWTKTNWSNFAKIGVTIVCGLVLVGIAANSNAMDEERMILVTQAQTFYKDGNIQEAAKLADQATKIAGTKPKELVTLLADINQAQADSTKLQSTDFLKKTLVEMADSDFQLLVKGEYKKVFSDHDLLNKKFLTKLKDQSGLRAQYLAEVKKEQDNARAEAIIKDITDKAEARTKLVEKHFSPWDGSHYELTRMIKDSMNDASSYEHVSTTYQDKQSYLIVTTTFRGKNAFGALILKSVKAKVSLDGDILDILEE